MDNDEMDDLSKIIESIECYLLVIDSNLTILHSNECIRNKFYPKNDSHDGKSLINLLQKKDQKFYQAKLREYIEQNHDSHKLDIVIEDNAYKLLNVSLSLKSLQNSMPPRFIVSITINHQLDSDFVENAQYEYKYLKAIFDNTSDAIFMAPISKDGVHGNFVKVNAEACRRLGYTEPELLQLNARTINPEANMEKIRSFGATLKKEGRAIFEAIHQAKDGTHIPVEVNASVITMDGNNYVLSIVKDQRAYKKLQKSESLFGRLMNHSWNELYVFNSETLSIIMANKGAVDNLGVTESEVYNSKFTDFLINTSIDDFKHFTHKLFTGDSAQLVYESTFKRKNGTHYPVEVRLQLSHGEVPPVYLANVQDITERKKIQERLTTLANYDMLTGLPNRALFMDRLSMAMKMAQRNENLMALMFIDLDGFKDINDSYGHDAGDELLVEVATRLKQAVRETDTIARLGGDEFTVVLTNIHKVDAIDLVIQKITSSINKPVKLRGKDCHVSPSIGVAIYPLNDVSDSYELIRQADMAMYQAKKAGKNTHKYFSSSLFQEEARKIELTQALKRALGNNELETYFQPRISLHTGELVGAEILLRWNSPEYGFVSPVEFIPIMEESGLIQEVGAWVFESSCKQLHTWQQENINIRLSINVSAKQFEDREFIHKVEHTIQQHNLTQGSIELEITEGLLISQPTSTAKLLNQLKQLGVLISLDDFGTGYSSLSYLKQFPIDVLKIDRSFVMDMTSNQDSLAIVKAIIGLAKSLNRSVTAEGIETQEHVDALKQLECDEGQGFYLGKPMPLKDFEKFIENSQRIIGKNPF